MPHTPGPLHPVEIIGGAGTGFHQYIADADGRNIGCCWGKAEEKLANALLWSTSPDMAALLRLIRDEIEAYGGIIPLEVRSRIVRDIDAVLAKATNGGDT